MPIATRSSKFDISKKKNLEKVGAKLTKMSKDQADYISVTPEGPYKPDAYRY